MELKWTKTALTSIDEIAGYIALDNGEKAMLFIEELQSKILKLRYFPGIGKIGRVVGTRELVLHDNYIVIYRVCKDELQILRIQHVRRGYSSKIK